MVARAIRVALVGDFNPSVVAHRAIPMALNLAGRQQGVEVQPLWAHTSSILRIVDTQFASFDGIWCVPASPYANTLGALAVIRYARETGRPFLGTCGGFQHALLEYARNVCGMAEAAHAETDPGAPLPLIAPLACSLVERSGEIVLAEGGQFRRAYGQAEITEGYHCSYGLNREYESHIFHDRLRATAYDRNGEVRGVELAGHPFFVAALFQPERRALTGEVPPLAAAFVAAMAA
jgi:CTP synthase (UTP-ammonia lyase)